MYDSFAIYKQNEHNNEDYESNIPTTTFPCENLSIKDHLLEQLQPILIISDPSECNNNLSLFMKLIIEKIYVRNEYASNNYQELSVYALRLLNLNLFIRNYELCLRKLLGLLAALNQDALYTVDEERKPDVKFEIESFREFICIILLLLLKLTNSFQNESENYKLLEIVRKDSIYKILSDLGIVTIVANVLAKHIAGTYKSYKSPFLLMKFGGDIIFEYLYHLELLSDNEFESLTTETNIIPTIIRHLLENDDFDNYDTESDDLEGENKLFVYEEFKLLLLINEQYVMKSYSAKDSKNKVFDGLMKGDIEDDSSVSHSNSDINGFINLLIYYINREESQIIKILILKFLYLIFTTSYTSKLFYLNDLKILLDIFIRELNDLDYSGNQNGILIITYLKVLYPLLMFSQLSELAGGYKNEDLLEILRNLVLNSESGNRSTSTDISESVCESQTDIIAKLSMRCMTIPWLRKWQSNKKKHQNNSPANNAIYGKLSAASSSSSLNSKLSFVGKRSELYQASDISNESLGREFTRIASVRTSGPSDYHKHTAASNESDFGSNGLKSSYIENNHNIFLDSQFESLSIDRKKNSTSYNITQESNLLDLPKQYLKDKSSSTLSRPPSESLSIKSDSSLAKKALKKKAPPPPVPPKSFLPKPNDVLTRSLEFSTPPSPPPPPPPRRRRLVQLYEH